MNKETKLTKQIKYPSKTSFNLFKCAEKKRVQPWQWALFFAFLIALGLFTKFCVIDRLALASEAKNNYEDMLHRIEVLQAQNVDYDEVRYEYSRYSNGYLTEEELAQVDRLESVELLEEYILNRADYIRAAFNGNSIDVFIVNTTLNEVADIINDLELDGRAEYITVKIVQYPKQIRVGADMHIDLHPLVEDTAEGGEQ